MNVRSRTLGALALGAACALGAPTPAAAADFTTHSKLRVEAGGDALEPGANYSNTSITTQNSDACGEGGNSATERLRGANAIGIVGHAARFNDRLSPFRTSDKFSFAPIVCRLGEFGAFDQNRAWLFKVNHEFSQVGGDQRPVGRSDEVLWYFANFESGENTGDELDLRGVPGLVDPGDPFEVETVAYDGEGDEVDPEGVTVTGGVAPAISGADGSTQVTAPLDEGLITLRGTRDETDDIPTPPVTLCVGDAPTDCPKVRAEYVGTDGRDLIQGTDAPDLLRLRRAGDRARAGAGADYIYARGGGSDTIVCGPGDDVVKTARGEDEFPADDCEDRRFPE
jgi:hypothetical protein